jgi:hypothetical protein
MDSSRNSRSASTASVIASNGSSGGWVYYRWQKELFAGGAAAFAKESDRQISGLRERLADAEAQLARKNEVLAEVMEE